MQSALSFFFRKAARRCIFLLTPPGMRGIYSRQGTIKGVACMEKNLTTGSVLKNVVSFSLPYLLSYFLQTLYGMADLFIIGQFGGVADTTAAPTFMVLSMPKVLKNSRSINEIAPPAGEAK